MGSDALASSLAGKLSSNQQCKGTVEREREKKMSVNLKIEIWLTAGERVSYL